MFRKTVIAIVATATLVAVALPTAASAKKWGHHHRHGGFVVGLNFIDNDYSNCGWEWVRVSRHYVKKVYMCY